MSSSWPTSGNVELLPFANFCCSPTPFPIVVAFWDGSDDGMAIASAVGPFEEPLNTLFPLYRLDNFRLFNIFFAFLDKFIGRDILVLLYISSPPFMYLS